MKSRKFSHFEIFKIVITTLYMTSGIFMFGTLINNASNIWNDYEMTSQYETERIQINCENCDEID